MAATRHPSYWMGDPPTVCDIGREKIEAEFIDGATTQGPWANMCPNCFRRWGRGLGTGRGQRYTRQADGRYVKTEG